MKHKMQRFFYISFPFMIVLLLSHQVFSWYYNKSFSKQEIDRAFESVISKYGTKIVFEIGDDFLSHLENPPIPAGPGRNSKVTPIRHRVLLRYPEILQKAFSKYPNHIIQKYLSAIHFSRRIQEGELEYGGTYDPFRKIVYLIDNGQLSGDEAMSNFHHEFSSLVLKRHSFFVNPWTDENPPNHEYSYNVSKDTLKTFKNASLVGTDADYEKGFMNTYGETDFENDFNEYSAMIFTYPQKFKQIMEKYPRVRAKFLVWLDFYQKVDPVFTEKYLFGNT